MAKLFTSRGSQNLQVASFVFDVADTMVDVLGATKSMSAVTAGDFFKVISLPPNAEIIGGSLQTEVIGVGPTAYTAEVGTSTDGLVGGFTANLLAVTSLLVATQTAVGFNNAFTLTAAAVNPGLQSAVPNDIYLRLIRSVAVATAGKFVIRVQFIQRGKIDEAVPA